MSEETNQPEAESPIVTRASELRTFIEDLKNQVKESSDELKKKREVGLAGEDQGEQIANAMLAFRHLEDAKMRIGKVIQATVGKSVYDK